MDKPTPKQNCNVGSIVNANAISNSHAIQNSNNIHVTISEDCNYQQIDEDHCNFQQQSRLIQQQGSSVQPIFNQDLVHENILLQVLKNFHKHKAHSETHKTIKNPSSNSLIPQPLSSDQQQSQQAQYLSYFDPNPHPNQLPIPLDPNNINSNKRQKLNWAQHRQFLSILYQCVIYVRKCQYRTQIDDQLLADRVSEFITVGLKPQSKGIIGQAILGNGYCLVAYAVLMGRVNMSSCLLGYLLGEFRQLQIEDNVQDFHYYCSQPIEYFEIAEKQTQNTSQHYLTKSRQLKRKNLQKWKQKHHQSLPNPQIPELKSQQPNTLKNNQINHINKRKKIEKQQIENSRIQNNNQNQNKREKQREKQREDNISQAEGKPRMKSTKCTLNQGGGHERQNIGLDMQIGEGSPQC